MQKELSPPVIIGALGALLLAIVIAGYFFLFRPSKPIIVNGNGGDGGLQVAGKPKPPNPPHLMSGHPPPK